MYFWVHLCFNSLFWKRNEQIIATKMNGYTQNFKYPFVCIVVVNCTPSLLIPSKCNQKGLQLLYSFVSKVLYSSKMLNFISVILFTYLWSSACVSICTATACHAWATEPVASLEAFKSFADSLDNPFAYWDSRSDLKRHKNKHH